MNEKIILSGACLCGAIKYQTIAMPFAADHCHCGMCQKSTGAVMGSWMDFKAEQVIWLADKPTEFESSENGRRGFCPTCGSTMSYGDIRYRDYVTLAITSLEQPNLVAPTYHIHTDSQLSWLVINDDCERYAHSKV